MTYKMDDNEMHTSMGTLPSDQNDTTDAGLVEVAQEGTIDVRGIQIFGPRQ